MRKVLNAKQKAAVSELYTKHHKFVTNLCKGYVKRLEYTETVEDIAQNAWEQVCRKFINNPPPDEYQMSWLKRVTLSACADLVKAMYADKRAILAHSTSLDAMTDGNEKYL